METHSEEQFRALLGMAPSSLSPGGLDHLPSLKMEVPVAANPFHRVNQGALLPIDTYFQAAGLRAVELSPQDTCATYSQGKHIAAVSSQRYASDRDTRHVEVFSAICVIDERIYPLLPLQVTASGNPVDFGRRTESFEFPFDSAALVIDTDRSSTTCAIVASSETTRLLKKQLRRAADNVGLWEGANGAALLTTLAERSALMGLTAWHIDRQNQSVGTRSHDSCVGFSAFNASDLPYLFGRAVIASESATQPTGLYEISFECRYTVLTSLPGFGESPLEMVSMTDMECRDINTFSPLTLNTAVADAKPGSYLHSRAMRFSRGDSSRVASNFKNATQEAFD